MPSGFAFLDTRDGRIAPAARFPWADPALRFNDGRCDRRGRFWAGTMHATDLSLTPHGALYRLDAAGDCRKMQDRLHAPNSLAWSPDDRVMYFADTRVRTIFACPYDIDTGAMGPRRVFATPEVMPDGATVDSEGFLWSAAWGGGRITRYAPDGRVDREMALPVRRPTACTFGGPDLGTLFITTATWRETAEDLRHQPLAGAVLAFEPGVAGLPDPVFAG